MCGGVSCDSRWFALHPSACFALCAWRTAGYKFVYRQESLIIRCLRRVVVWHGDGMAVFVMDGTTDQVRSVEVEASVPFANLWQCFFLSRKTPRHQSHDETMNGDIGNHEFDFEDGIATHALKAHGRWTSFKQWVLKIVLPQPWSCPLVKDQVL